MILCNLPPQAAVYAHIFIRLRHQLRSRKSPHSTPPPASGRGSALRHMTDAGNQHETPTASEMERTTRVGCRLPPLPLAREGWGGGTLRDARIRQPRAGRTETAYWQLTIQ